MVFIDFGHWMFIDGQCSFSGLPMLKNPMLGSSVQVSMSIGYVRYLTISNIIINNGCRCYTYSMKALDIQVCLILFIMVLSPTIYFYTIWTSSYKILLAMFPSKILQNSPIIKVFDIHNVIINSYICKNNKLSVLQYLLILFTTIFQFPKPFN